ncbi:MAG: hypothetical protein LC753_06955 [Acidobacteria bacterium]|nr:hypothetical protein [Acidobacteriota bacterium]MCA1650022.1 hypothetical protein [Acidobacteriota bacterium]
MIDAAFDVDSGTGPRRVELSAYLDASLEEIARLDSNAWIKRVRLARVDGAPLRRRFAYRGDSLWWFAELYLHKQEMILGLFRTLAALETLVERERPLELRFVRGNRLARGLAPQVAGARQIRYRGSSGFGRGRLARRWALDVRGSWLMAAAVGSRLRARAVSSQSGTVEVAAFVHRAFWRSDGTDGSAESYIGPVLAALERRVSSNAVRYVGIGPPENFRGRRWWHPLRGSGGPGAEPIEHFASLADLKGSRDLWRIRHLFRRALHGSNDLRQLSMIRGADCWPIVLEELNGIALLQWPWSARAMDEAGATLDALRPAVAVTYAEAGGWGRALVLECRRRKIPTAGLQHGFIYRHWLNYLHEPDEMEPDRERPDELGFPRPSLTLLFDDYAARHLASAGRFPRDALCVTGSPRLDALVETMRTLRPEAVADARTMAGATGGQPLVLVVTKYKEARAALPALLAAAGSMPDVQVAIKSHPAETAEAYGEAAKGHPNVRILGPAAPLGPLILASRAVVTVNSTVALDAAVLGVPALVIGLPNNLSPFVEAGVMAGAAGHEVEAMLRQILYNEEFRQHLEEHSREFLGRFGIASAGDAAERAADAVLALRPGTGGRGDRHRCGC